jgi:hypothetical protein
MEQGDVSSEHTLSTEKTAKAKDADFVQSEGQEEDEDIDLSVLEQLEASCW